MSLDIPYDPVAGEINSRMNEHLFKSHPFLEDELWEFLRLGYEVNAANQNETITINERRQELAINIATALAEEYEMTL